MRSIEKYYLVPELLLAMGLVGFACATQAKAAATESDTLKVKDGTNALVVNFSTLEGGAEFFSGLQVGVTPANFKPGTLFFTGADEPNDSILTSLDNPAVDVSSKKYSDALSMSASQLTGKFNVFFISDGATAANAATFPIFATQSTTPEVAGNMDVSAFFGFAAGSVIVTSDADPAPEPGTLLLSVVGVLGLIGYGSHRPKHFV
jgi:hypothetical protein